jgi:hypothetical protein
MKLIAHRGNISGAKPEQENNPEYVMFAITEGYDVEIDLWVLDQGETLPSPTKDGMMLAIHNYRPAGLYLGHDKPSYKINEAFLTIEGLWIHCKNHGAFEYMVKTYGQNKGTKGPNFFWHQSDDFTITSQGDVWPFTDKVIKGSILNQPTRPLKTYPEGYVGICSDNVSYYKDLLGL